MRKTKHARATRTPKLARPGAKAKRLATKKPDADGTEFAFIEFEETPKAWRGVLWSNDTRTSPPLFAYVMPAGTGAQAAPWSGTGNVDGPEATLLRTSFPLGFPKQTLVATTFDEFKQAFVRFVPGVLLDFSARLGRPVLVANFQREVLTAEFLKALSRRLRKPIREDRVQWFLVAHWKRLALDRLKATELAALVNGIPDETPDKIADAIERHFETLKSDYLAAILQLPLTAEPISPAAVERKHQRLGLYSSLPPGPRPRQ